MKITFENLGALRHAELEMNDFTVLCGENNTGKTYLTYAIYGLIKFLNIELNLFRNDRQRHHLLERTEWNIAELADTINERIQNSMTQFCQKLPAILASPESRLQDVRVSVENLKLQDFQSKEISIDYSVSANEYFSIEKQSGESILKVAMTGEKHPEVPPLVVQRLLTNAFMRLLFGENQFSIFIASTERTGAVMFKNELNLTKNRLIEAAHQLDAESASNPLLVWQAIQNRVYPLPVRDNLDFLTTLSAVSQNESDLLKQHPTLLAEFADLIGGSLTVNQQSSDVVFQPVSNSRSKLSVSESSSSVRSLLMLSFYLKHVASPGALLMVDEPELNLHPRNQRRLAQLMVRLLNCGLRIFVTTHSDYFLRELNHLIMLSGLGDKGECLLERHGYRKEELLEAHKISVYAVVSEQFRAPNEKRKHTTYRSRLKKAQISPIDGIDESTFDETILRMNEVFLDIQEAHEK